MKRGTPRGEPTWPGWRKAEPGTRVEHVSTGRTGTFVLASTGHAGASYALIEWDPRPGHFTPPTPVVGRVVAPAYDLRVIDPDTIKEDA